MFTNPIHSIFYKYKDKYVSLKPHSQYLVSYVTSPIGLGSKPLNQLVSLSDVSEAPGIRWQS